MITQRAIGPFGTIARLAVGLGLIAVAVMLDGVGWRDLALGLIGIPVVLLLGYLVRLRFTRTPLRATGPIGQFLNCLVVAALLVPSATRPAALVWLGVSMLLTAWRGYAGCESLAISNWLFAARRPGRLRRLLAAGRGGGEGGRPQDCWLRTVSSACARADPGWKSLKAAWTTCALSVRPMRV